MHSTDAPYIMHKKIKANLTLIAVAEGHTSYTGENENLEISIHKFTCPYIPDPRASPFDIPHRGTKSCKLSDPPRYTESNPP